MLTTMIVAIFSSGLILLTGAILYQSVKRVSGTNDKAQELAGLIADGLVAFNKRILSSIFQIIVYLTLVLLIFSFIFKTYFSWIQIAAFMIGGGLMASCSYLGLSMAPNLIPKVLYRSNGYLKDGLTTLYASSAAIGFIVTGLMILGLVCCYLFFDVPAVIGFGLGVVLASFFLRIGGGIYKTGTDIGSDIASKVEKNVPDFDSRSPATILDVTGDYVGDIVGFGSDMVGSFTIAVISCILFAFSMLVTGPVDPEVADKLIQLPLYVISIGLLASLVAYFFSVFRIKTGFHTNFLLEGIYLAVILCGAGTWAVISLLDFRIDVIPLWGGYHRFLPFPPYVIGLVGAVLIGFTSEYLTSTRFKPARRLASLVEYGPVISLFRAFSVGLKSNGLLMLYILGMAIPSFYFAGFYGIAMAALGMLSITSLLLTANIFSPFASNIRKVAQLSGSTETIQKNAVKMDKIGTTTAALGNGFAAGAALLSSFSLLFSLVLVSRLDLSYMLLVDVKLLSGLIIGLALPSVFSGFLLPASIKSALCTVAEVSRQFKEIPYLFENKAKPDIRKAADLNAIIAMNAVVIPGFIMGLTPIASGYIFGSKLLFGLSLGTFLAGMYHCFYWANFGDVLHNVKHYIEGGHYGGKNSPTFYNILIADNVGDGFKDLLSPSINILIKSVVIISILVIWLLSQ